MFMKKFKNLFQLEIWSRNINQLLFASADERTLNHRLENLYIIKECCICPKKEAVSTFYCAND